MECDRVRLLMISDIPYYTISSCMYEVHLLSLRIVEFFEEQLWMLPRVSRPVKDIFHGHQWCRCDRSSRDTLTKIRPVLLGRLFALCDWRCQPR